MGSSKYKGVTARKLDLDRKAKYPWKAQTTEAGQRRKSINLGMFRTEREAAIAYDMAMIKLGRAPVNILKPKQ